jgi:prepilin-type N-terminal cleavage/methylation domain-containing protein
MIKIEQVRSTKEEMMNKFRKTEEGFTLIELMIVIAIIGILAAIAIPQFSAYRTRSYNSAAQADLRNLATAQEAYYVDFQTYYTLPSTTGAGTIAALEGAAISENVTVVGSATATGYILSATHSSGDKTYSIDGPGGVITN